MTEKEYIYIPIEKLNPFYWIERGLNKTDQYIESEARAIDQEFWSEVWVDIKASLVDWGLLAWDWFVSVTPDLVGYAAIGCGGYMMFTPMVARSLLKPLGIFSAVGIAGAMIVGGAS